MKRIFLILLFSASTLFGQITGTTPTSFLTLDYQGDIVLFQDDSVRGWIGLATGFTGSVDVGVPAFADSLSVLDTASYDNPYLNRCLVGFGTGTTGQIQTSGIVAANNVTKIGIDYYLGNNGTLQAAAPTARNVWRVKMGRCIASGFLLINPDPDKCRWIY